MQRARGNFSSGRGRNRGRGGRATSQSGLFADGVWHCDCEPRLPASHFQVKKDNANKGRWFWTCQQNDPKSCKFFLWEDDSKPREMAAVMNNTRTEPPHAGRGREAKDTVNSMTPSGKGLFAPTTKTGQGSSSSSESPAAGTSYKRTASEAQLDEALGDDDFDELDEDALAEIAGMSSTETPHKALKIGVYATPSTSGGRQSSRKLPWLKEVAPVSSSFFSAPATKTTTTEAPSTPLTTPARKRASPDSPAGLDITPSRPSTKQIINPSTPSPTLPSTPSGPAPPTLANPSSPSPPPRFRDAFSNPGDADAGLTQDVLALLARHRLPSEALATLRAVLSAHDLRMRGVRQARDLLRSAGKRKDEEIVELKARIAGLEAEGERDKGVIRRLRGEKARGEGRVAGFQG